MAVHFVPLAPTVVDDVVATAALGSAVASSCTHICAVVLPAAVLVAGRVGIHRPERRLHAVVAGRHIGWADELRIVVARLDKEKSL